MQHHDRYSRFSDSRRRPNSRYNRSRSPSLRSGSNATELLSAEQRRRRQQNRPFPNQRDKRPSGSVSLEEQERRWRNDEGKFVLAQRKKGAWIRGSQGRGDVLDALINACTLWENNKTVMGELEDLEGPEINLPQEVIEKIMDIETMEKVLQGVKEMNEKDQENLGFWKSVLGLCEQRLKELKGAKDSVIERVIEPVSDDIEETLKGKNLKELEELEIEIDEILSGDGMVDTDFWSHLKAELTKRKRNFKIQKISLRIDDVRKELFRKKMKVEATSQQQALAKVLQNNQSTSLQIPYDSDMDQIQFENISKFPYIKKFANSKFRSMLEADRRAVESQGYITQKRTSTPHHTNITASVPSSNSSFFDRLPSEVGDNEETLVTETALPGQVPGLLKPRYFNRVLLGYEWTKHNQLHYSSDNPPPKLAQGYKFNLFYPELANSTSAPTYRLIRDEAGKDPAVREALGAGESDTCIIRFTAPKPYQDIAFRIVDKPWDSSSHKGAGFKSRFENGVLQLHFRFKKIFYRK